MTRTIPHDFKIEFHNDDSGNRYAYPVSNDGEAWFNAHAAEFDLCESGAELDATENGYAEFTRAVTDAGMTYLNGSNA